MPCISLVCLLGVYLYVSAEELILFTSILLKSARFNCRCQQLLNAFRNFNQLVVQRNALVNTSWSQIVLLSGCVTHLLSEVTQNAFRYPSDLSGLVIELSYSSIIFRSSGIFSSRHVDHSLTLWLVPTKCSYKNILFTFTFPDTIPYGHRVPCSLRRFVQVRKSIS